MEFHYSSALHPSTYDSHHLCDGIQPRLHNDHEVEDLAIIRAHEDWRGNVAPIGMFRGCLDPKHSFVSLCMPECLPERLDIVSYANEFGFLHDDVFENAEKTKGEEALNEMIEGFQTECFTASANQAKSSGKRLLQSKMVLKMLSIDRERALTAIQMWTKFLEMGGGGGETQFNKLADYIEYRIEDVGKMTWSGLLMFGCAITIPEHEKQACSDLCRSAWIALSLTNDLYSWDKERRDTIEKGESYTPNALYVVMQEHSVGLEEAKEVCRKQVRTNVKKYLDVVERTKRENKYSKDLIRFMDGLVYSIGGNLVWSTTCPRYNADTQFNDQQVEWMTNGIPDHLRREKPITAVKNHSKGNGHTNGHTNGYSNGHSNGHLNGHSSKEMEQTVKNTQAVDIPHRNGRQAPEEPSGNDVRSLNDVLMDKHLPELPIDVSCMIYKLIPGFTATYELITSIRSDS